MRQGAALLALVFSSTAQAQAQAGTVEVEADGCKLYLPQAEARGASRVRWSGNCADGLADGRGVVRIYSGGRISLAAERTFSRGAASGPGESYTLRGGQVMRSRGADSVQVAPSELPGWALEFSMLVEDRPARAAAPSMIPPAPAPKAPPIQTEMHRQQAEAKAAAEKAEKDRLAAQRQEAERLAAEKAALEAERKRMEKARMPSVPGRGFADGGAGAALRAVVTFKLTTPEGRELGIATFVAGKGEEEIRRNAAALAAVYEKVSPFKARLSESAQVGPVCGGPGFVVEARVTLPSAKSYGWYAGCMGEDLEQAAARMRQLEDELHRDFKTSPSSFWGYQYLIVGYVDEAGFRGREQYESVAQPGMMAPGRVLVLPSARQWAECTALVNADPKLKDKVACLREAVTKLKSSLSQR